MHLVRGPALLRAEVPPARFFRPKFGVRSRAHVLNRSRDGLLLRYDGGCYTTAAFRCTSDAVAGGRLTDEAARTIVITVRPHAQLRWLLVTQPSP
jgi:hypothetical protein